MIHWLAVANLLNDAYHTGGQVYESMEFADKCVLGQLVNPDITKSLEPSDCSFATGRDCPGWSGSPKFLPSEEELLQHHKPAPPSMTPELRARLREIEMLHRQERAAQAIELLEQLSNEYPGWLEVRYRHAALLLAGKRATEAVAAFEEIVRQIPQEAHFHNVLGGAQAACGDARAAAESFRRACQIEPRCADYWYNLGRASFDENAIESALEAYACAVGIAPDDPDLRMARADVLAACGQSDAAAGDLRRALAIRPGSMRAWTGLVNLKTESLSASELAKLRRQYARTAPGSEEHVALGFVYGQALDAAGMYQRAFEVLERSNRVKAQAVRWVPQTAARYVAETINVFSTIRPKSPVDAADTKVVFLVGLPRSGSTLAEQVLAAHPEVHAGGEITQAHAVIAAESERRGERPQAWAGNASPTDWARLGRQYLEARHRNSDAGAPVQTDKQLDNWRYVGFLHAMLPRARFVFCVRDPLETLWSCYKHNFHRSNAAFAYSPVHLASYWRQCRDLMAFWDRQYPGLIYTQKLEMLVQRPEAAIRDLLDYCGLEFYDGCLRFHESGRAVRTASAGQVRQPLQQRATAAECYGALLDPFREALNTEA